VEERNILVSRYDSVWIPEHVLVSQATQRRRQQLTVHSLYGAQGPTAFSNGPTCVEVQGDWIIDAMKKLRDEKIDYCDATHEAEMEWREKVTELSDKTLL
jgi:hypothetical protein